MRGMTNHERKSSGTWTRKLWLTAAVAAALLFIPCTTKEFFSCAICQAKRSELRVLGMAIGTAPDVRDTECSIWYRENVEPQHEHVWVRGAYAESRSLCGIPFMSISSARAGGPIVRFGAGEAMIIYQHSPQPSAVRAAFLKLARWEQHGTQARADQTEIERRLARWLEAGCPEPWPLEVQGSVNPSALNPVAPPQSNQPAAR
jgi:hypothetical protein